MSFDKNISLESALRELNEKLFSLEKKEMQRVKPAKYPNLLLVGNSRTGSTLFLQWMSMQQSVGYPSNFLSRLYKAPYIGTLIYNILTKPEFQYKNEFSDINKTVDFMSSIGKTQGFKSPHEFWYFWRRFIDFPDEEPYSEEFFAQNFDFTGANQELALLQKGFGKPFLLKAKIMNFYLESLFHHLDNALFIHIYRNPVPVIRSLIKARREWTGSIENWFSWKPREYPDLIKMDIYHQVAGQVYFIDREILSKRNLLGTRYLSIKYENFCENPEKTYDALMKRIKDLAPNFKPGSYTAGYNFQISNAVTKEDDYIMEAYSYFECTYGKLKFD